MKTLQSENGFTLIEVLIAMVVLTIGILSLYAMQMSAIRGNSHANRLTEASTWNADQVEKIIGLHYSDANLKDINGDGTNKDLDRDGIDNYGNNFGLDNATVATADGNIFTSDGKYTIFWNVAKDVPMPNLKTVRVIVKDNSKILSTPVVFTYIKDDII